MKITISTKGDFKKTESLIEKIRKKKYFSKLESFGEEGVNALSSATPVRTGETAQCWNYKIEYKQNSVKIFWNNTNLTETGVPIVVLIQYGHITNNGGYVEGVDFINPAIRPVFEKIATTIWKDVTK